MLMEGDIPVGYRCLSWHLDHPLPYAATIVTMVITSAPNLVNARDGDDEQEGRLRFYGGFSATWWTFQERRVGGSNVVAQTVHTGIRKATA